MELIFIGTASGRTQPDRFHASILFRNKTKNILVDTGDAVSRALHKQDITFNSITDIVLSHYHSDHIAGLSSLLTQMIIEERKGPLNIITHLSLINSLNLFLQSNYIFIEKLKFEIQIIGFSFDLRYSFSNKINFIARQNSHITNKHAIERNEIKFISSSFLFRIGDKKIIYTSDLGNSEDLFLFDDIMPDIFITETTHLSLNHIENAAVILDVNKIILTHIDNENELNTWYNKLGEQKREKFIIAFDGMSINLSK